ncbi:Hypothetical protein PROPJV5_1805 [Propionibacterium ruminifibrarum]|uniref:Uncharacterized protein n=1 Tax=Propionibacterium ruminifibrarum TaxID=1962131 RepID=A0A375I3X4_9ACTN|nr:Hypothetical protein PROPJV5_1805 [Propionibacterium ruminifibrarum]
MGPVPKASGISVSFSIWAENSPHHLSASSMETSSRRAIWPSAMKPSCPLRKAAPESSRKSVRGPGSVMAAVLARIRVEPGLTITPEE